jgi:thiamine biosynthesis protein ThiS
VRRIAVVVKVFGQRKARKVMLPPRSKVADLLKQLNYNPDVVAVRCNKKIVPEGERLANGDLVEIIPIVTGG